MSAFHVACVEGDIERLGKEQKLYNPIFVDESTSLVHELLSVGRVPVGQTSGRGSKKRCEWKVGTPAELAVRAGHFDCANLVLSVPLFRWMKLAPWTTKFRNCTKMVFTRRGDIMKDLLAFLGSRQWVHLTKFCKGSWECDVEALHTLLAACILGQTDVVRAILSMNLSIFDEIDAEMRRKGIVTEEEPMYCRDLTATAAALGGDAACLKLVLDTFHDYITTYTLQEVWICLKNPLWMWTVPQWPACLNMVVGKACFEGVKKLSCEFEVFCLFFIHLNNWFTEREAVLEKYQNAAQSLPPSEEVLASLKIALPTAISMIHRDCLAKLDLSTFFKKVIDDSRKSIGPTSCLAKLTEEVVISIFTHEATASVLMGRDVALTLSELSQEQQMCYLATVCQFMVVMSPGQQACQFLIDGCALCHPLVNYITGVRKPHVSVLSEKNLWTLFPYFSQKEMFLIRNILRKPPASSTLCATHRGELRHGRYPLFGGMRKKAPHVLEVLDTVRKGVSLQQLCVMQVLRNLQGDHRRLGSVEMAGGLRRYFLLEGFLEKLSSPPE